MAAEPPFRRFDAEPRAEHSVAWLRLVAACVVTLAGLVVLAMSPTVIAVGLVALLGPAAVVFWVRAGTRGLRAASRPPSLDLTPGGLVYDLPSRGERHVVPWPEVRAIELDEDSLTVRVVRRAGAPLVIEALGAGVSVYALGDAIRRAREEAETLRDGPSAG